MSDREIHHHHGGATALVFGLGIGAWLVLRDEKAARHHAAAAPRPVPVHTVIVHDVTTRVVHSGMPGWGIVVIAVVALGVLCAITLARRGS